MPTDQAFAHASSEGDSLGLAPLVRARGEVKTADRVFDALAAAIRDVHLIPGSRLSETALAQQLEVSRTPIREAIARLVEVDLLQVLPQVGTRVARIRMSDVEEARFVRETLEVGALELICAMPTRDVSVLRGILASQEEAALAQNLGMFFSMDEALHKRIFSMSGYPGAWEAVARKKIQLDRIRRLSLPDPPTIRELIDEHAAIVDAIEGGDANAGTVLVRAHARRVTLKAPELRQRFPEYFED